MFYFLSYLKLFFPDCPAGSYLYSSGSLSCDSCPPGSSSSADSTSCTACPAGKYSSPSLSLYPTFFNAPSTGLQMYYRFDSVSGSRVGNIATGSVVYYATLQNGAIVSNNQLVLSAASSQYMSIDSFTTGTTGLTFATWWRSDNSGSFSRIFEFGNGPSSDNIMLYKKSDGILWADHIINGPLIELSTSVSFDTGDSWKHVAWTLDPAGSGTWIVYINGIQVGLSTSMTYPRSILRYNNYLGKSNWLGNPYMNGGIKDFRMYSRVLSAAEVNTLFTSTQKIFIGASNCESCLADQNSFAGSDYCTPFSTSFDVPYYSISYTNSAQNNTVPYTFTVCSQGNIKIADYSSARCSVSPIEDQYIRLFSNGIQVTDNDDTGNGYLCSTINYRKESDICQTYTLQQGCYSNLRCQGQFTINFSDFPTQTPTRGINSSYFFSIYLHTIF